MIATQFANDSVRVLEKPSIPGLIFRRFRGNADYPSMLSVLEGAKAADGIERSETVEDIARSYRHLHNCDPERDMLLVEIDERVVGYGRVWWDREVMGDYLYQHFAFLLPEARGKGIRRAMLRHNERRLREIATVHPNNGARLFECWAADSESHWIDLLQSERYAAIRRHYDMVRPGLNGIPSMPLPEMIEVRPVEPEHVPMIFEAAREAFQDEWAEREWQGAEFDEWKESPTYNPSLWQVAWEGDQVAGMVLNYINAQENEEYGRLRGYTESICVRRPWRRQGLARALIARSFQVLKDQGMTEAALGVDTENPSGAFQLYTSMGFRKVKGHATYRKPMYP